ncbi:Glutathione S-transferase Mu 2 [Orchesella cincta]|uniref:Glutathione S-transferase Mu 2 n=1 Tax=Orchesella cincta TaxID=48709 RepID=A0A1D2MGC5_ORCCI|nr:Glutathione S-transferase Mu 2 [Orchesella cincta]
MISSHISHKTGHQLAISLTRQTWQLNLEHQLKSVRMAHSKPVLGYWKISGLPYLIDGDFKVTESRAILKYLCRTRKPELLGKSLERKRHKEYKKELERVKLGYLSSYMRNIRWIAGSDITYVDFFVNEILYQFTAFDLNCLDKFENLKEFMKRFEAPPAISKYRNSPEFLHAPLYSPSSL